MVKHNMTSCCTWLMISMVVMVLIITNLLTGKAEIDCRECVNKLMPCTGFLIGIEPAPSAACCTGAQELDRIAVASKTDKKAICVCLKEAASSFPIDCNRGNQIAPLCHLKTKFVVNPHIDCNKI